MLSPSRSVSVGLSQHLLLMILDLDPSVADEVTARIETERLLFFSMYVLA